MTIEYCDGVAQWLFQYRNSEDLVLRTRFKIQDVIDSYNDEWKPLLDQVKKSEQPQYVPKNQILTEAQVFGRSKRKDSGKNYMYRPKSLSGNLSNSGAAADKKPVGLKPSGMMANLLSGLKAEQPESYRRAFHDDDSHEDDEDADKMIERRISMNKDNKIGTDFESHLIEGQPKQAVKNEIENMFNEYRESEDK